MTQRLHILLPLGVAWFMVFVLVAHAFMLDAVGDVSNVAATAGEVRTESDAFTLGQYYFNHDDDPAGPYDLGLARAHYLNALEAGEDSNKLLWYQLGRIDFLEGRYDVALWRFGRQLELFGEELPNVYYMLGLTYGYRARETGFPEDWQRAEENFSEAVAQFPEEPWPKVDLAWIYFSQGKYEEMRRFLQSSLTEHGDNAWYLNAFGLSLLHTGERDTAHEYFKLAAEEAALLTTYDWGQSYPGNDPGSWERGLAEMRQAIAHNIEISGSGQ